MKSIFFTILLLLSTYESFAQEEPILDSNEKTLNLSGSWKFNSIDQIENAYPNIDDTNWLQISIPGLWRSQNLMNVKIGWYRKLVFIGNTWDKKNLAIISPAFTDAYEFYFNGSKIGGEGKIDDKGKCVVTNSKSNVYFIPQTLVKLNELNTIAVRVCNYAGLAGAFGDIDIGESSKIKEKFFRTMIWNISIGMIFLFVSIYFLILFSGSKKDLSHLYFAAACFFASSLTLGYYRFIYWFVDSYWINFYFLNSGFGLVTLFLVLFTYSFFEYKLPPTILFFNFASAFVFASFLISSVSNFIFQFYINIGQPFLIIATVPYLISITGTIYQANRDKKRGARIIGVGLGFLICGFILGILSYFNLFKFINLIPESFLAFILCIAVALSVKFYTVNDQLLSMEKKHTEDLEKKIQERTKDLEEAKKTAEIETGIAWIAQRESQDEKEKTEKLLKEVQKDMLTAQKIQQNILPQNLDKIKKIKIATLYKPFSSVGGDFYDIAEIKPGIIRAFIADATGHGVQAALITMAIKSEYESVKDLLDSPSLVLKFLNENFSNKYKSLNIYFTAFIIDIDITRNKIIYSSAGHSPQILINENRIQVLSQKGHIVGMIPYAEYEEVEADFKSGRLYLFTDGIAEEFSPEQEQFGEERIIQILERSQEETIQKSLDVLFAEMLKFIGTIRIRDDITAIGIEYKN